ncbi:uncharacterized protein METZ01_LOCUS440324, partial [marine metagenome]
SVSELSEGLITHPHPEVRREVARRLALSDTPELERAIRAQIDTEEEPRVQAALLLALAASAEADAVDDLSPFINADSPLIAEAAMIGLLRTGGVDGILVAGERLLALERSADPTERVRAAHVLGDVGNRGFYRHRRPLLTDPDATVRTEALVAAGKISSPRLWPDVLASLDHIGLHRAAASALVASGEQVLPTLIHALSDQERPVHVRSRIAAICGNSAVRPR